VVTFHRRIYRMALLGFMIGALTLEVSAQNHAPAEPVTLQLKWKHQFQFAGYYAAMAQGYYREAGLDVTLVEAKPGKDPVEAVLNGAADFGVGTSELLLLRGQGKPVVVLATIFQHSPLVLLARQTNEITDLQALHNQPIMIEPQSAELFAYFENEGINPDRLQIVHHTFDVDDLIEGRVAAMSAYVTDELFLMEQAKIGHLVFTPRAGGIDFYGDNLFTTEAQIRAHPARVRKFREASLRGWEYAMEHPDEIIDHILREFGDRKSRAHLEFEAMQMARLMHPGLIEIGHTNPGRWQHMAATYQEFGMLPANFDLAGFVYDADPRPNYRWAYWSLGVVGAVALAAIAWLLPLQRLNRQLRAAKEEAEAADLAKTRYLAFMTHELRTPLNGIIGLIDVMRMRQTSTEQSSDLDLMEHAAQTQLRLIDGVLDYAKLEAGRLELAPVDTDLPALVAELTKLFHIVAQRRSVTLESEIRDDVPRRIIVDVMRLRQVLSNLIANAVKFTSPGSVRLVVSTEGRASNGAIRLVFAVSDTGIGMDAVTQARLFKPYVQGTPEVSRKFGGTGLGLYIARQLALMMDGDITVQSAPGKGSTFTVRIAVPQANAPGV